MASFLSSSRLLLRTAASLRSTTPTIPSRSFNLHEYQSKGLLDKFGVNTQPFGVASTPDEAYAAAEALIAKHKTTQFVVKAQIHAGGRGVGHFSNGFKGGVHLVSTPAEVKEMAAKMLGQNLITKQTPPEGVPVRKLMIAHALDFKIEYYLSFVMDRESGGPCLVFSADGGVDIETVAKDYPELIYKYPVNIETGLTELEAQKLAYKFGFVDWIEGGEQIRKLYELFIKCDCSQLEINPWAQTSSGAIYAIDAKLNFDESSQYRQKEIFDMRDPTEEDPREVAAAKVGLNYIGMDGSIGCMVNGAGLAMATMDEIKLCGGSPANFLDVGGGATESQVENAFRIITSDPAVKAILINIFGGIMRCDVIARGIVEAAKKVGLQVPMVVRLAGTNFEEGARILRESGLKIITASDLHDGAQKAVACLKQ